MFLEGLYEVEDAVYDVVDLGPDWDSPKIKIGNEAMMSYAPKIQLEPFRQAQKSTYLVTGPLQELNGAGTTGEDVAAVLRLEDLNLPADKSEMSPVELEGLMIDAINNKIVEGKDPFFKGKTFEPLLRKGYAGYAGGDPDEVNADVVGLSIPNPKDLTAQERKELGQPRGIPPQRPGVLWHQDVSGELPKGCSGERQSIVALMTLEATNVNLKGVGTWLMNLMAEPGTLPVMVPGIPGTVVVFNNEKTIHAQPLPQLIDTSQSGIERTKRMIITVRGFLTGSASVDSCSP